MPAPAQGEARRADCVRFAAVGFRHRRKKREIGDARNQLFREMAVCSKVLRPRAFVMEQNVSGMVKADFKIVFAEILRTLKRCGYRVKGYLLNAMFYLRRRSRASA